MTTLYASSRGWRSPHALSTRYCLDVELRARSGYELLRNYFDAIAGRGLSTGALTESPKRDGGGPHSSADRVLPAGSTWRDLLQHSARERACG